MKIIHSRPRRWIVFPSASHAIYEHDDGYTKTICGHEELGITVIKVMSRQRNRHRGKD